MATPALAKPLAPTPKLPDLSGETIAVQVGNEVVHVHEFLISSSSEFFKNATKPEWRTESRPIDLSDEQPHIFKRYCQWLYSGHIAPDLPEKSILQCLAYMYVLGEKIVDHEFQNAVIQAIISDMGRKNKKAKKDLLEDAYRPFLNDLFLAVVEKRLSSPLPENEPWILQPHPYHREAAVLKSDVAEQKDGEMNSELVGRDQMDISEA
ncbi:unnamed protein product [Alternaria alternata]